ncbi:MAG: hypothetical protein M0P97_01415 [Candidatus Moranbacteria bacterium]|jgi:hypothetical protein|nr:hypothetical protein [Candidatus Moranbacteria bacterium]
MESNETSGIAKVEQAVDNGSEESGVEGEAKEVSHEEAIEDLTVQIDGKKELAESISASVEGTNSRLDELREKMGLPVQEDDATSVSIDKETLEKEKEKKGLLEKEKEERIFQQERQRLVEEEKKRIIKEKIEGLFEEFSRFSSQEVQSLSRSGRMLSGGFVESGYLGKLAEEVSKIFASSFEKGAKTLSDIEENLPELLEQFDEQITAEAEMNVDERLENEKVNKDEVVEDISSEAVMKDGQKEEVNGTENSSQEAQASPENK